MGRDGVGNLSQGSASTEIMFREAFDVGTFPLKLKNEE